MARRPRSAGPLKAAKPKAKPTAASTAGQRKPAPAAVSAKTGGRAKTGARGKNAGRAKIRMYRQGLGDCFLISLSRASGKPYRIMIDCGVILGTPDSSAIMTAVVEDIARETGGTIDLLLATHQHWDHLSGFVQATEALKKLTFKKVWLAWTEDPADQLARELAGERDTALRSLRLSAGAMRLAGGADEADEIDALIGFFGAAGGASTEDALNVVKALGPIRYCRPSDPPVQLADPDARLYVLGPPHDRKLIRKTLPSTREPETYGVSANAFGANVLAALDGTDDAAPFGPNRAIPLEIARGMDFFRAHYWGPGEAAPDWRRIDTAWLDGASELALALDSATNNTSLVLAIEFADGDVLLFVADAQVGNWLSWETLDWTVDGRKVTAWDLLRRAIVYKVGHHGSHNATLKAKGLDLMERLRFAMIPVDHAMAVKKRWGNMPLPELVAALGEKARDGVLRLDETPAKPPANVVVDKLYFEISV
ncbi:MBL fold metallo-hydrolase [Phreatobacter stygius]|uniref:Uncharacterized protein n=1 Tax=Phreatobacter stygius TaxID=1940610 RepID=A0A4D7B1M5_9HYPH|nr:MBL fold metallo-hydrolase [Phreatobacter stygius]QCI66701.1 hypothetical protein E8M01_22155 [Phreatobacter stygius]